MLVGDMAGKSIEAQVRPMLSLISQLGCALISLSAHASVLCHADFDSLCVYSSDTEKRSAASCELRFSSCASLTK